MKNILRWLVIMLLMKTKNLTCCCMTRRLSWPNVDSQSSPHMTSLCQNKLKQDKPNIRDQFNPRSCLNPQLIYTLMNDCTRVKLTVGYNHIFIVVSLKIIYNKIGPEYLFQFLALAVRTDVNQFWFSFLIPSWWWWIYPMFSLKMSQHINALMAWYYGWLDWICLTTTHVLQDTLAVLHK